MGCTVSSICCSLEVKACGLFEVEEQVHVVYRLSAGALEQVVDAGGDEEHVAVLLQVDEALVSVDDLLQVNVVRSNVSKRVLGIVVGIQLIKFLDGDLVLHHDGAEDTAREVAAIGHEMDGRVEAALQLVQRFANLRQMLVGKGFVNTYIIVAPAEVSHR